MTRYRLMGLDHFDYESYEVGIYDSYEEAEKARRERASHDNSFGTGMGDTYHLEKEGECKHCDATFFGFAEMVDHGLKEHHDLMRELGYSERQLIKDEIFIPIFLAPKWDCNIVTCECEEFEPE